MRKSKSEVDDFGDVHFFASDEGDLEDFYLSPGDVAAQGDAARRLPARQRLELRNEQRSLRQQLSDWDDYDNEDFDTAL